MSAHHGARRWRAPARRHGPARWAALVLLAVALTVVHLAAATGARGGETPPAGESHTVAAPAVVQPPAAHPPSSDPQPGPCRGCPEGHSAVGVGHLCLAVLGAVLLAAGVRRARRRLPALDRAVPGRSAVRSPLVPAPGAAPPWTHPTSERLCVRRV